MALDRFLSFLVMPLLFVLLHLAALVLSLVYWRRCPAACSLLFPAAIMSLIGSVGRIGLPFILPPGEAFFGNILTGLTVLNWLGYGLMLMAIFAGRNEPTRPPRAPRSLPDDDDDDDDWLPPKLPLPPPGGIQSPR